MYIRIIVPKLESVYVARQGMKLIACIERCMHYSKKYCQLSIYNNNYIFMVATYNYNINIGYLVT